MTSATVVLGSTGIRTSSLVLGCARLGSLLTPIGPRDSVALVEHAFELGIRHFDTASAYGQGDSERFIGRALRARRADACIATKAGQRLTFAQALLARCKGPLRLLVRQRSSVRSRVAERRRAGLQYCFEPDYLERSLEHSLRRLGTDYVDIFYLHSPPREVMARDDVLTRLDRVRARGKARALGISCDSLEQMVAAVRVDGISVVQGAWEADERCREALRIGAERGKVLLLRAGAAGALGAVPAPGSQRALAERIGAILALPGVGGAIVGTTQLRHLEQDAAAWRAALSPVVA